MVITIRKADTQDFTSILALIKEFSKFQKSEEKVSITLDQMNEDEELFKCLIAENEHQEIIGFCTYFFAYYSWTGKALYLDDLYVKEFFRKQGIGKMLLDEIISLAKKANCKKLRWQVSKWNSNAIEFYKKTGAAIDDTEINCDLILM